MRKLLQRPKRTVGFNISPSYNNLGRTPRFISSAFAATVLFAQTLQCFTLQLKPSPTTFKTHKAHSQIVPDADRLGAGTDETGRRSAAKNGTTPYRWKLVINQLV